MARQCILLVCINLLPAIRVLLFGYCLFTIPLVYSVPRNAKSVLPIKHCILLVTNWKCPVFKKNFVLGGKGYQLYALVLLCA